MFILKTKIKKISVIVTPLLLLVGCGGGGGSTNNKDNSPAADPSAIAAIIHIATDTNNQAALLAPSINQNTYTLDIRRPGVMETGGDGYTVNITAPSDLTIVTNTCHGSTLHYGATCEFSVEANNASRPAPNVSNHYQPETMNVNIEAINTATGQKLSKTIPVSLISLPAITQVSLATSTNIGSLLNNAYHTANISEENISSSWINSLTHSGISHYYGFIFPFNVPLIYTYDGTEKIEIPLAMATRCGNTLIYFVAQQKLDRALATTYNDDNVTVKYHPLIADGVTSGVAGNPKVLNGELTLREEGPTPIIQSTQINAHDGTWSGPENVDRLRELITTNSTSGNSTIISVLDQLNGDPFIDPDNVGVDKIITVHSLLNTASADKLRNALDAGDSVMDIANAIDSGTASADEDELLNALGLYLREVTKACYIQTT
ncbi:hypothetical protein [Cysteiniphilum sp. JM-1]|uniref:hypothetical protein n=1 Tax=Cysteiniphilum sp. JM-1 TaxID=2610891 RepID=UPI001246C97A|nr:hypothetical protein [Cysteiniphilum sp. JM-1]